MMKHDESTNREKEREAVIARLIANTRRKKRPNNLLDIARDIRRLQNELGSLEAASETIGISTDQSRQFLSVEHLCPEVQQLVEERKIDLVNIVHYMRSFNSEAQQVIAREVIEGRLTAEDIRALAPLQKKLPCLTVEELVSKVQQARDIRMYVAYFHVPPVVKDVEALKRRFERIVGQSEILSFAVEDQVGILELTSSDRKKLRSEAKERNMSLRKFVDTIVLE